MHLARVCESAQSGRIEPKKTTYLLRVEGGGQESLSHGMPAACRPVPPLPEASNLLFFVVLGISCLLFPFVCQPPPSQSPEEDVRKETEPDNEVSHCCGNNIEYYL